LIDDDDDDYEEPAENSPILWRRQSLDQGMPRLRQAPKAKEENEMEYLPEKRMRKRSISEDPDVGDESDSEEEKPKKLKVKRPYKGRKGKGKVFQCSGIDTCTLCKGGPPHYLQKSMNPGWRETLLAVFENFGKRVTYRDWLLKKKPTAGELSGEEDVNNKEHVADVEWLYLPDSYGFLEYHWDILCPPQHKNRSFTGTNWRKTLQDTLSHNRTYFLSGKELFGKTGFWRLAESVRVQHGIPSETRVNMDVVHSPRPPSMFTIDTLLKRAEGQGHIPSFGSPSNSSPTQPESSPEANAQTQMSELELLVSAIEKMHSACS